MGRLRAVGARVARASARVAPPAKRVDAFYQSAAWTGLVADVKAMRGAACERCGAGGRIYADHVRELKDGGAALDPANIELLCAKCHGRKTARARALRSAGAGALTVGGGQKAGGSNPG